MGKGLRWMGAVAVALLVTGSTVAVGGDPTPGLEPTERGWRVTGFVDGSEGGDIGRLTPVAGGSVTVEVAPGGARYLMDSWGRPLGILSGPVSSFGLGDGEPYDGVQPLSVILDRHRGELVLSWRPVPGADLYEISIDDRPLRSTSTTSIRVPVDQLDVEDLVDVVAVDEDADPMERIIGTMTLIVSEFTLGRSSGPPLRRSPISRAPVPPGRELLSSSSPNDTHFRFKTFIPGRFVSAPIFCNGQGGFSTDRFFRGTVRGARPRPGIEPSPM